jgi:hypothetical protein
MRVAVCSHLSAVSAPASFTSTSLKDATGVRHSPLGPLVSPSSPRTLFLWLESSRGQGSADRQTDRQVVRKAGSQTGRQARYCIVLYCTALLHCTALHCTALHCIVLYCTALLHCTALYCTALHTYRLISPVVLSHRPNGPHTVTLNGQAAPSCPHSCTCPRGSF